MSRFPSLAKTWMLRAGAVAAVLALLVPTAGCDTSRAPAAGEVSLTAIEVTQGISSGAVVNDRFLVPLIAHKRTYVRVWARAGSAVDGVGARLSVRNPGVSTPLVVLNSANPHSVSTSSGNPWGQLTDSFLFALPDDVTMPGVKEFTAQLTLPQGGGLQGVRPDGTDLLRLTTQREFGPSGDPVTVNVWTVSYGVTDVPQRVNAEEGWSGSTHAARPISDLQFVKDITVNLLPITDLTYQAPNWLTPDQLAPSFPCDATVPSETDPSTRIQVTACQGALDQATRWAAQIIDAHFPSPAPGHPVVIMVIQPERQCGCGAESPTPANNEVESLMITNDAADPTLAHELAHGFGVGHTPNVGQHVDSGYPRRDGSMGPYIGLQWAATGGSPVPVSGFDADGHVARWDIMSYTRPAWISPYSYCKAMAGATAGAWQCADGLVG